MQDLVKNMAASTVYEVYGHKWRVPQLVSQLKQSRWLWLGPDQDLLSPEVPGSVPLSLSSDWEERQVQQKRIKEVVG